MSIDSEKIRVFAIENEEERKIGIADKFATKNEETSEYEIVLEEDLLEGQNYVIRLWFYKLSNNARKANFFNNW